MKFILSSNFILLVFNVVQNFLLFNIKYGGYDITK